MEFEWDSRKNESNFKKHGFYLTDAKFVFDDENALTIVDNRKDYGENRFVTIGMVDKEVVVSACHTDRAGITRIISVRRASKKERRTYNDNRKNDI